MAGVPAKADRVYFYPRSPCGERRSPTGILAQIITISIHALLAESDHPVRIPGFRQTISIHALLAESDVGRCPHTPLIWYFYPRSPCGERRHTFAPLLHDFVISIHALLAESDLCKI